MLSERDLANRVRGEGVTRGTKTRAKRQKVKQKQEKSIEKGRKTIKQKRQ